MTAHFPGLSLADLADRIRQSDLPPRTRSQIVSDITAFAGYLNRDPTAIAADHTTLRAALAALDPRQCGISAKRLSNVASNLRRAQQIAGIAPGRVQTTVSPLWANLLQQVRDAGSKEPGGWWGTPLIAFIRYLDLTQIPPDDVRAEALVAYETHLATTTFRKNVAHAAQEARAAWNRAVREIPAWPRAELPKADRRTRTIAVSLLPAPLRAELDRYVAQRGCPGVEPIGNTEDPGLALLRQALMDAQRTVRDCKDRLRILRPLATATIRNHRHVLEMAAVAHHERRGGLPETATLADLVTPEAVSIFGWIQQQRGLAPNTIHAQVSVLRGVARRWCGIEGEPLEQLNLMLQQLEMDVPKGMSARPRKRLLQILAVNGTLDLLRLPGRLLERAEKARKAGCLTARHRLDAKVAAALLVLQIVPLRRGNLATLDLDRHLRLPKRRHELGHIAVDGRETKGGEPILAPFRGDHTRLLQVYLRIYRPLFRPKPDNRHLFPGRGGTGHASLGQLARLVSDTIRRETGLTVNLHLFRHLAATILFHYTDGNKEAIRALLGHDFKSEMWEGYALIAQTWATGKFRAALEAELAGAFGLTSGPRSPSQACRGLRTNARRRAQ